MDNVTYPHKSPSLKMCLGKQFQKSFCCGLVLFFLMIASKVIKIHFHSNFLENYVFETENERALSITLWYAGVLSQPSNIDRLETTMLGNVSYNFQEHATR